LPDISIPTEEIYHAQARVNEHYYGSINKDKYIKPSVMRHPAP
jgi:hypothetical protein